MENDEISIEFGVIFKLLSNSVDELEYPLNVDILQMGGKDVSGNDIFFKITYLKEDENSHKMVISDGSELEKDLKYSEYILDWATIRSSFKCIHVFILKSFRVKTISVLNDARINCKLKLLNSDVKRSFILDISGNDQLLTHKEILGKTFDNVEYPNRNDGT